MTHINKDFLKDKKHIHFIGIGGSGMFPLVQILHGMGYYITGSDNNPGDTIDHDLALHDIKIIQGADRLFVAMPSRRDENGEFRDICHPITLQARQQLEQAVLDCYQQYLQQQEAAD